MPKRITEYHSKDWEILTECGWITERIIDVHNTDDPLWLLTRGEKRIAVMTKEEKD